MTAPKAKALGFFNSFSVQNIGRWASFAYCDMLLGFYRVFVWLFQRIEDSPSDFIDQRNCWWHPPEVRLQELLQTQNRS